MLGPAIFSPCKKYRYTLHRTIQPTDLMDTQAVRKRIVFLMLNPSIADEEINDPTVAKCCTYARMWGFSDLVVVNIFAYRSTDPSALRNADDPIGEENDKYILDVATAADMVVCAWGNHGKLYDRGKIVTGMLRSRDLKLYCLKLNKDGSPVHPLYQRLDEPLKHWEEADEFGCSIH